MDRHNTKGRRRITVWVDYRPTRTWHADGGHASGKKKKKKKKKSQGARGRPVRAYRVLLLLLLRNRHGGATRGRVHTHQSIRRPVPCGWPMAYDAPGGGN
eukprot:2233378-Prymnesium_polylepis.1